MQQGTIRYVFVDILKGIAILLIVYGHIIPGAIPCFTDWVSTFHIPLFFFVSGLLYNETKYRNNFRYLARERCKGLVLPFLLFSIIVAVGYIVIVDDYRTFVISLFTGGWGGGYALWFVPVLLMVEMAFYPICKAHRSALLITLLMCAAVSFVSAQTVGLVSNNALLAFCGIYFYGLGNLCRPLLNVLSKISNKVKCILCLVGLFLSLLYVPFCSELPKWFVNEIPSPVFYISPLFAIMGMVGVSLLIEQYAHKYITRFFAICGRYSLIILAFHQIICMIAGKFLPSKLTILTMILLLTFLVWFIPKYAPWMLGKSKQ